MSGGGGGVNDQAIYVADRLDNTRACEQRARAHRHVRRDPAADSCGKLGDFSRSRSLTACTEDALYDFIAVSYPARLSPPRTLAPTRIPTMYSLVPRFREEPQHSPSPPSRQAPATTRHGVRSISRQSSSSSLCSLVILSHRSHSAPPPLASTRRDVDIVALLPFLRGGNTNRRTRRLPPGSDHTAFILGDTTGANAGAVSIVLSGRFDSRRLCEEHFLQRQQGLHLPRRRKPGNYL